MKQLDLFDNSEVAVSQYGTPIEPNQLARRTDPETSKQAARSVAADLSETQRLFFTTLKQFGYPATAQEVAEAAIRIEAIDQVKAVMAKRDTLRKRAKELVDKGWIVEREPRECRVTCNNSTTYEVN
jgi:alkylation response protein AidB-like acyl-CoA dehydrogenase